MKNDLALCSIFHIGIEKIIDIRQDTSINTDEILSKILLQLKPLNYKQLLLIEKFIVEIIPYLE